MYDLVAAGPASDETIAKALEMKPDRVAGFLRYLGNEDIVSLENGVATLTARGHGLKDFRPWYELLVGGYAGTFGQITDTLSQEEYATRDGVMVGKGSCGISRYDALPLVRRLLSDAPIAPTEIVDIGCGNGDFLIDLMRDYPGASGIGVDPFAPVGREADGSVVFRRTTATDYLRQSRPDGTERGDSVFVGAFMLQEVLEQEGRAAVVEIVHTVVRSGAYFAVVEVDHRVGDLVERETECLQRLRQPHAVGGVGGVAAVPGWFTVRGGNDPPALVEPHRVHGDAGRRRYLTDLHRVTTREVLTLDQGPEFTVPA